MRTFIVILLLGLLPMYTALNCYSCTSGMTGCNDPFNAAGSGVSTTGNVSTNTYCIKTEALGVIARYGSSACVALTVTSNTFTKCCQTDLCNGARGHYQTSILLVFSVFLILIKFKWV